MARAAASTKGSATPVADLEEELALLGELFEGSCGESCTVLAEFWEQADEALVRAVVEEESAGAKADLRLPPPSAIAERPDASTEARIALRSLTQEPGWSLPWPVDEDCDEDPSIHADALLAGPCASQRQPLPARPATATRPSGGALGGVGGGASSFTSPPPRQQAVEAAAGDSGGAQTKRSGFRAASEMFLPPPTSGPPKETGGKPPPNFDDVSRAIVGKGSKDPSRGQVKRKADTDAEGREWSDEWLCIADKEQLDRIVPALEATVHKASGTASVARKDIAGLGFVKTQIEELLILPRLHPQLFASALTRPARGLLLFGPPGTGKTLLAKWIAAACGATFFNINASSVLSKWIGEAEKTVKALFQLARERQPSVIFVDEVDSLLSQRRDADNECSRRLKNEFLTSLEGADTEVEEKVLLVGATNMPWELDQAALRRLPKRLYVPLPGSAARTALLKRELGKHDDKTGLQRELSKAELASIAQRTEGYSGSDLRALLQEAAMGPVREASAALGGGGSGGSRRARGRASLAKVVADHQGQPSPAPRNIRAEDFDCALRRVKPSFNEDHAQNHRAFNEEYGTCRGEDALQDDESSDGSQASDGMLLEASS